MTRPARRSRWSSCKDDRLSSADVKAWCEVNLTGYKRPRVIEFRTELPKSPVGKILRRELRDQAK